VIPYDSRKGSFVKSGDPLPGVKGARVLIKAIWLSPLLVIVGSAPAQVVLDKERHHLGIAGQPEWDEFAADTPEGRMLKLSFEGRSNPREATLFIRQENVKLDWRVQINNRPIGRLLAMEARLVHVLPVPAGVIRDGANTLVIEPPEQPDDVVIDRIALDSRPVRQSVGQAVLDVSVTDADTGARLPCRITVTGDSGALAPLVVEPDSHLAVRTGVVYTSDGHAHIALRPGRITLYASRGFEYSVATRVVSLDDGHVQSAGLAIRREVATPGLVACDTHVHTYTHSGHGDATIDERVVTLAGEGIELPIATDHDVCADLDPAARHQKVRSFFTPVIGDEVTTRTGHFNAFTFRAGSTVPDHGISDWTRLLTAIRSATVPGSTIVILNHPRDLHAGYRPFDPSQFNAVSGEHRRGMAGIDAIEVINSGALQSDPMQLVRDWMALLNHGERVTAVAGSDSHDVARFIAGQGRTYLECRDDDPSRLDVPAACRALREGRAFATLGLLATATVMHGFHAGDLARGLAATVPVTVTVAGPSWTSVDRIELYANGIKLREQTIAPASSSQPGIKARATWEIPRPEHDMYLVAVASGPGVTAPFWAIPRPYQPTSRAWTPRVMGIANPIFLDGDGDGAWTCPKEYAGRVVERAGTEATRVVLGLAGYDEAVAAQAAALCHAAGRDLLGVDFTRAIATAAEPTRRGFAAFVTTLTAKPRVSAPHALAR
jgi:hypothetical protein